MCSQVGSRYTVNRPPQFAHRDKVPGRVELVNSVEPVPLGLREIHAIRQIYARHEPVERVGFPLEPLKPLMIHGTQWMDNFLLPRPATDVTKLHGLRSCP